MERGTFSYRFGSAEFDEARFELKVAGLPVEVEKRALEVLAYLLRHAGEVVTKDELLEHVWAGRITVEKVLPNAITKLRRALGQTNADLISTQARIGYRLDGPVSRIAVGRQSESELRLQAAHAVPGRSNFILQRELARTGGSEVWLAEQSKTREVRVYKFGLLGEALRALKREATLMRLLQESFEDTYGFVELIDWNFEQPPFFLECQYGGQNLQDWCTEHLSNLDRPQRLELFLQIARAVARAHSVGVLHKDLKPANVLVAGSAASPLVRLTDFGSGELLEPGRLDQLGITRLGLTINDASSTGTPIYMAPEVYAGQAPTVQSDVYALGILLYQLLSGRIAQPMASGFEHEIDDALLVADLKLATDGEPSRRLKSAQELVQRLEQLGPRRLAAEAEVQTELAAARDQAELLRTRARRPYLVGLIAVLLLGLGMALWLGQAASTARNLAKAELARAQAVTRFLTEDLIGRGNPLITAKGAEASLRDVLLSARDRLSDRFADEPVSEAVVRSNLAMLFNAIELMPESLAEAERALLLLEQQLGRGDEQTLQLRALLTRVYSRTGKLEAALAQLQAFERDAQGKLPEQFAAAQSTYFIARSEYQKAEQALARAVALSPPGAHRDSLRLDWITVLSYLKSFAQARRELDALIEELKARKGDAKLLIALAQLAGSRAYEEDFERIETLLLEAKPVLEQRLGSGHSRVLQLLAELQRVAFHRQDWPKAIQYAQAVHEGIYAKFGAEHPMSYVTLGNVGRTLFESGAAPEAAPVLQQALDGLVRTAGVDAASTHDVRFVQACAALENGDIALVQRALEQLNAERLNATQPNPLWPQSLQLLRGLALLKRGDQQQAEPLLKAAWPALRAEAEEGKTERFLLYAKAQVERLDLGD